MRLKTVLMGSVSALATGAVATVPVQAQDQDHGYTFSVQGGALLSKADQAFIDKAGDKSGSAGPGFVFESEVPDNFGYMAGVTVGKRLNSEWDVMFGASVNRLMDGTAEFAGSGFESSGSSSYTSPNSGSYSFYEEAFAATGVSRFGFETMEFDVGFRPVLGDDMNVRLFGGIQGIHAQRDTEFGGFYGSGGESGSFNTEGDGSYSGYQVLLGGDISLRSEFFGVGPRVGMSAATSFGNGFGLSGSLAGSAVYGRQTDTISVDAIGQSDSYSGAYTDGTRGGSGVGPTNTQILPIPDIIRTEDKFVFGLEASAGVDYYLDQSSTLTVGYQAKSLYNVGQIESPSDNDSTKLTHGPFLKFQSSF